MIQSFKDQGTQDIFNGRNSKPARKKCATELWRVACRKLDQLDSTNRLEDLRQPAGNRLECLEGDRAGQFSVRINDQYRICFVWSAFGPDNVEIVEYH